MLNLRVGSPIEIEGKNCILTQVGSSGHAVYGPYRHLDAGHYVVEFNLAVTGTQQPGSEDVCATVDVASDFGRVILAREDVTMSRLCCGALSIRLPFYTEVARTFEFRVAVTGYVSLLIENYCRVLRADDAHSDHLSLLEATRFPDPRVMPKPLFFLQNLSGLRRFYENDATIKIVNGDVVVSIEGVSFYARVSDDLRFIEEVFYRNTYNFVLSKECCVIDIGMNIGLVSLRFAQKDCVKEIHSFEPFKKTYDRACANLGLNPAIASKITSYNIGLASADEEKTVLIYDKSDSGAFSIHGSERGSPEHIFVRNAAAVLKPIIDSAKGNRREIVAKVDCEGSEFAIFEALEGQGLLSEVSVFMVEWHRGIREKTQHDLIAPLARCGFVIFDLTGKIGNGFFYAVRSSRAGL